MRVSVLCLLLGGCGAPITDLPDDYSAPEPNDTGVLHEDTNAPVTDSFVIDSAEPDTAKVDSGAPPPPSKDGGAPSPPDAAPPPAPTHEQHCVDVINKFRAKIGRSALARSTALETFAKAGAKSDSETGDPHGHFIATSGGGIAWAENEIPGWTGDIDGVIEEGTQMMWDEGPGVGHYENLSSFSYKQVGCGIFVTPFGEVWITQDFR